MERQGFFYRNRFQLLFCILLLLNCVDRFKLLQEFTFRYVDDDQAIMWNGAKEFGEGRFHEPYFFGQNYNTMFESLLAVPLIKAGLSYSWSLTLIMSLLTLFPYFLLSYLLLRKGKGVQSLVVLSIPLLLPPEFGMTTAISRGCVVGIFFSSFALMALFTQRNWRFFVFGFFSALSLFASQNAAVILFPLGVWLLFENFRSKNFYLYSVLGALPVGVMWFLAQRFCAAHPQNIVHHAWAFNYDIGRIMPRTWNAIFGYVVPLAWNFGVLVFPMLIVLCIFLYRQKQRAAATALVAGTLFVFFSLGINKVHDGYDTVFYSWARMYMALPLVFALFLSQVRFSDVKPAFMAAALLVPLTFFVIKLIITPASVYREVFEKKEHNMYVAEISELDKECTIINKIALQNNVKLVVVGKHATKHLINYACPCLKNDFPVTLEPELDRRTWVLTEEAGKVYESVLFAAFSENDVPPKIKNHPFIERCNTQPLIFILKNNQLNTASLLNSLGIPMRPH